MDAGYNIGNIAPGVVLTVPFIIVDADGKLMDDETFERISQTEGFQSILQSTMFDAHHDVCNSGLGQNPQASLELVDTYLENTDMIDEMAREIARDILRADAGLDIALDDNDKPEAVIDANGEYQTIYSNTVPSS